MGQQGISGPNLTTLVNNQWTAQDYRDTAFGQAYGLISLNSHFDHYHFFPNRPNNDVACDGNQRSRRPMPAAWSIPSAAIPALNVYDGGAMPVLTGTDFAQAFTRQGATFVGNTGFGYGDSDLVSYSELLALNFTQELGYNPTPATPQRCRPSALAMMRAKQRYLNSFANGALTTYDEKVMAEMTVYGLPMLKVNMPIQSPEPPGGAPQAAPSGRSQEVRSGLGLERRRSPSSTSHHGHNLHAALRVYAPRCDHPGSQRHVLHGQRRDRSAHRRRTAGSATQRHQPRLDDGHGAWRADGGRRLQRHAEL